MSASVLYDTPGPQAKRRDRAYNIVFTLAFTAIAAYAVYSLINRGVFDDRWQVLWDPPKGVPASDVWTSLLKGLGATMFAAAVAAPLAFAMGGALSILRRGAQNRWVGTSVTVLVELSRGLPVLLLMFLANLVFGWSAFWSVVFGLVVYNVAVIAEILRAGLVALPAGQREAGFSVGLGQMRTTLMIELPQATRIMLPALISQIVVILKDSSLGFIVSYSELLRTIRTNREFFGDRYLFPLFLVGAGIYIAVNLLISRLATVIERRLREGRVRGAPTGVEPKRPLLEAGLATDLRGKSAPTGHDPGGPEPKT